MLDEKTPRKDNNFGALRLFFASIVILAHSPAILDGNSSRELLTNIFGTLSSGVVGVDGFFIISGYLITNSFLRTPTLYDYAKRRVLRIYPAFIVCFWLCLLVLAPLVGAGLSPFQPHSLTHNAVRMALLFYPNPNAEGTFSGMPYPWLNGPMWSIPYEFHCYILVVLLGAAGVFRGWLPYILLVAVLAGLTAAGLAEDRPTHNVVPAVLGDSHYLQLLPMFFAGTLYALFQHHIIYSHPVALAAAVLLTVCLFFQPLVPLALAVLGGYLIFWFAFRCPVLPISRFTNRTDLSYGIYLYAWPIQSTIAFVTDRSINPWVLSAISFALSAAAAWVSWTLIEKPALALAHDKNRRPAVKPVERNQSRLAVASSRRHPGRPFRSRLRINDQRPEN
jgi:peptidoglycan/LPS O-acetylase OafA/YrhL